MPKLTLKDKVLASLREATQHNGSSMVPPEVILWLDPERQWEAVLPLLRPALPELLVLGDYNPALRQGPAVWLKCMVARVLPTADWGPAVIPVLYLPGISKRDLRSPEPQGLHLAPLREYQYMGVVWLQENGKEWTISAFIQNPGSGLGRRTATDTATKDTLLLALPTLFEDGETLYGAGTLDATQVLAALFPDESACVLRWLEDGDAFLAGLEPGRQALFQVLCETRFDFIPQPNQRLVVAERLGERRQQAWQAVWQHFTHAPQKYPGLPPLLRQAQPAGLGGMFAPNPESWPQVNEDQETALRQGLLKAAAQLPPAAATQLAALEAAHGLRRAWVWADLQQSPLAKALPCLLQLVKATTATVPNSDLATLRHYYETQGYQADQAMRNALAAVVTGPDQAAVRALITLFYKPWLELVTDRFQQLLRTDASALLPSSVPHSTEERFVLFVDAFRLEVAQEFAAQLRKDGYEVALTTAWSALPSVTPTAKAWSSPLAGIVSRQSNVADFVPQLATSGKVLNTANFRGAMPEVGYTYLPLGSALASGQRYWQEIGDVDTKGHAEQAGIVHRIPELLGRVREAVDRALEGGATRIRLVTDHGWLLLPDGLPKEQLSKDLVDTRWGRCALLKAGATSSLLQLPWSWNPQEFITYAPGISFFKANVEFAHGGLSLHECLVPVLTISKVGAAATAVVGKLTQQKWTKLRCNVMVEDAPDGATVDLRTTLTDAGSTLLVHPPKAVAGGKASLYVDDDAMGQPAIIVLLGPDHTILDKQSTLVGG